MSATRHTFIDIFGAGGTDKIVIPIIQRDYAQGRKNADVKRVRERFLTALHDAIVGAHITLDFVYGDKDKKGTLTPLDGQQRLTTLFLLHWYAAKKEKVSEGEQEFLKSFSYETRYSARDFCEKLVAFSPSFEKEKKISAEIIDQSWFPLGWKKDPTIGSMLVMLDAIQGRFENVPNIWDRLKNGAITFYFLPIEGMGLTDELYIKMNSRGKPLTEFEHFKAELEREIKKVGERKRTGQEVAKRVSGKIDRDWTDLLWNYRNRYIDRADDAVIDDEFLRYFRFICDIICYQSGEVPPASEGDAFDLLRLYFSAEDETTAGHIATLEAFFDCWCEIDGYGSPTEFLESFMGNQHAAGKIIASPGIFSDCLHKYSVKSGNKRLFPLGRTVLLYAIVKYLQNRDKVSRDDFVRRIRIVNNLIQNSEDEMSARTDESRIPAILKQVDSVILTGQINDTLEPNFNANQLKEEKDKIGFLAEQPEKAELVFRLEDHDLLRGQIRIVGLEHLDYGSRFASLFSCDWDKIDRALMATGDYGQREKRDGRKYQYASSGLREAWDKLFHVSSNEGFDNTRNILLNLLASRETFTDDDLGGIASLFLSDCEGICVFPWRYYYVKYQAFRPGRFGRFYSDRDPSEHYMRLVMPTQKAVSSGAYMPFLKEAEGGQLCEVNREQRLVYTDVYIVCENAAYIIRKNVDDSEIDRLAIQQNVQGVDTEDRILKLREYIRVNRLNEIHWAQPPH